MLDFYRLFPLAKPRRFSGFFQFFSRPFFGSLSRIVPCLFPESFPCLFPGSFPCLFPGFSPLSFSWLFSLPFSRLFSLSFFRLVSMSFSQLFFSLSFSRPFSCLFNGTFSPVVFPALSRLYSRFLSGIFSRRHRQKDLLRRGIDRTNRVSNWIRVIGSQALSR